MLAAIISDIHANLEAFHAVIDDMERKKPDTVICLGDSIGYGPDPEEVVKLVRQKGYLSVLGNHEAALAEKKMRNSFNFQAKENSIETEQLLSDESLDFCRNLPKYLIVKDALFVHGFPPDSVLGYVTRKSDKQLISFLKDTSRALFFVGHTHDLLAVSWDGTHLKRGPILDQNYTLQPGFKYIINSGSVGQPRDGDNRAKYILWHTESHAIETVQTPYDFKTTSRKIKERGFPEAYGLRLW
jgi:predicted phosphodiesterase